MLVDTKNMVSITEANQNFSKVTRMVDFGAAEKEQVANNEDIMKISQRMINKNREAYGELAK